MSNLDILEVALYNIRDKLELFYNLIADVDNRLVNAENYLLDNGDSLNPIFSNIDEGSIFTIYSEASRTTRTEPIRLEDIHLRATKPYLITPEEPITTLPVIMNNITFNNFNQYFKSRLDDTLVFYITDLSNVRTSLQYNCNFINPYDIELIRNSNFKIINNEFTIQPDFRNMTIDITIRALDSCNVYKYDEYNSFNYLSDPYTLRIIESFVLPIRLLSYSSNIIYNFTNYYINNYLNTPVLFLNTFINQTENPESSHILSLYYDYELPSDNIVFSYNSYLNYSNYDNNYYYSFDYRGSNNEDKKTILQVIVYDPLYYMEYEDSKTVTNIIINEPPPVKLINASFSNFMEIQYDTFLINYTDIFCNNVQSGTLSYILSSNIIDSQPRRIEPYNDLITLTSSTTIEINTDYRNSNFDIIITAIHSEYPELPTFYTINITEIAPPIPTRTISNITREHSSLVDTHNLNNYFSSTSGIQYNLTSNDDYPIDEYADLFNIENAILSITRDKYFNIERILTKQIVAIDNIYNVFNTIDIIFTQKPIITLNDTSFDIIDIENNIVINLLTYINVNAIQHISHLKYNISTDIDDLIRNEQIQEFTINANYRNDPYILSIEVYIDTELYSNFKTEFQLNITEKALTNPYIINENDKYLGKNYILSNQDISIDLDTIFCNTVLNTDLTYICTPIANDNEYVITGSVIRFTPQYRDTTCNFNIVASNIDYNIMSIDSLKINIVEENPIISLADFNIIESEEQCNFNLTNYFENKPNDFNNIIFNIKYLHNVIMNEIELRSNIDNTEPVAKIINSNLYIIPDYRDKTYYIKISAIDATYSTGITKLIKVIETQKDNITTLIQNDTIITMNTNYFTIDFTKYFDIAYHLTYPSINLMFELESRNETPSNRIQINLIYTTDSFDKYRLYYIDNFGDKTDIIFNIGYQNVIYYIYNTVNLRLYKENREFANQTTTENLFIFKTSTISSIYNTPTLDEPLFEIKQKTIKTYLDDPALRLKNNKTGQTINSSINLINLLDNNAPTSIYINIYDRYNNIIPINRTPVILSRPILTPIFIDNAKSTNMTCNMLDLIENKDYEYEYNFSVLTDSNLYSNNIIEINNSNLIIKPYYRDATHFVYIDIVNITLNYISDQLVYKIIELPVLKINPTIIDSFTLNSNTTILDFNDIIINNADTFTLTTTVIDLFQLSNTTYIPIDYIRPTYTYNCNIITISDDTIILHPDFRNNTYKFNIFFDIIDIDKSDNTKAIHCNIIIPLYITEEKIPNIELLTIPTFDITNNSNTQIINLNNHYNYKYPEYLTFNIIYPTFINTDIYIDYSNLIINFNYNYCNYDINIIVTDTMYLPNYSNTELLLTFDEQHTLENKSHLYDFNIFSNIAKETDLIIDLTLLFVNLTHYDNNMQTFIIELSNQNSQNHNEYYVLNDSNLSIIPNSRGEEYTVIIKSFIIDYEHLTLQTQFNIIELPEINIKSSYSIYPDITYFSNIYDVFDTEYPFYKNIIIDKINNKIDTYFDTKTYIKHITTYNINNYIIDNDLSNIYFTYDNDYRDIEYNVLFDIYINEYKSQTLNSNFVINIKEQPSIEYTLNSNITIQNYNDSVNIRNQFTNNVNSNIKIDFKGAYEIRNDITYYISKYYIDEYIFTEQGNLYDQPNIFTSVYKTTDASITQLTSNIIVFFQCKEQFNLDLTINNNSTYNINHTTDNWFNVLIVYEPINSYINLYSNMLNISNIDVEPLTIENYTIEFNTSNFISKMFFYNNMDDNIHFALNNNIENDITFESNNPYRFKKENTLAYEYNSNTTEIDIILANSSKEYELLFDAYVENYDQFTKLEYTVVVKEKTFIPSEGGLSTDQLYSRSFEINSADITDINDFKNTLISEYIKNRFSKDITINVELLENSLNNFVIITNIAHDIIKITANPDISQSTTPDEIIAGFINILLNTDSEPETSTLIRNTFILNNLNFNLLTADDKTQLISFTKTSIINQIASLESNNIIVTLSGNDDNIMISVAIKITDNPGHIVSIMETNSEDIVDYIKDLLIQYKIGNSDDISITLDSDCNIDIKEHSFIFVLSNIYYNENDKADLESGIRDIYASTQKDVIDITITYNNYNIYFDINVKTEQIDRIYEQSPLHTDIKTQYLTYKTNNIFKHNDEISTSHLLDTYINTNIIELIIEDIKYENLTTFDIINIINATKDQFALSCYINLSSYLVNNLKISIYQTDTDTDTIATKLENIKNSFITNKINISNISSDNLNFISITTNGNIITAQYNLGSSANFNLNIIKEQFITQISKKTDQLPENITITITNTIDIIVNIISTNPTETADIIQNHPNLIKHIIYNIKAQENAFKAVPNTFHNTSYNVIETPFTDSISKFNFTLKNINITTETYNTIYQKITEYYNNNVYIYLLTNENITIYVISSTANHDHLQYFILNDALFDISQNATITETSYNNADIKLKRKDYTVSPNITNINVEKIKNTIITDFTTGNTAFSSVLVELIEPNKLIVYIYADTIRDLIYEPDTERIINSKLDLLPEGKSYTEIVTTSRDTEVVSNEFEDSLVELDLYISAVDYDKLTPQELEDYRNAIKLKIITELGIASDMIQIILEPGSIKIKLRLKVPDNTMEKLETLVTTLETPPVEEPSTKIKEKIATLLLDIFKSSTEIDNKLDPTKTRDDITITVDKPIIIKAVKNEVIKTEIVFNNINPTEEIKAQIKDKIQKEIKRLIPSSNVDVEIVYENGKLTANIKTTSTKGIYGTKAIKEILTTLETSLRTDILENVKQIADVPSTTTAEQIPESIIEEEEEGGGSTSKLPQLNQNAFNIPSQIIIKKDLGTIEISEYITYINTNSFTDQSGMIYNITKDINNIVTVNGTIFEIINNGNNIEHDIIINGKNTLITIEVVFKIKENYITGINIIDSSNITIYPIIETVEIDLLTIYDYYRVDDLKFYLCNLETQPPNINIIETILQIIPVFNNETYIFNIAAHDPNKDFNNDALQFTIKEVLPLTTANQIRVNPDATVINDITMLDFSCNFDLLSKYDVSPNHSNILLIGYTIENISSGADLNDVKSYISISPVDFILTIQPSFIKRNYDIRINIQYKDYNTNEPINVQNIQVKYAISESWIFSFTNTNYARHTYDVVLSNNTITYDLDDLIEVHYTTVSHSDIIFSNITPVVIDTAHYKYDIYSNAYIFDNVQKEITFSGEYRNQQYTIIIIAYFEDFPNSILEQVFTITELAIPEIILNDDQNATYNYNNQHNKTIYLSNIISRFNYIYSNELDINVLYSIDTPTNGGNPFYCNLIDDTLRIDTDYRGETYNINVVLSDNNFNISNNDINITITELTPFDIEENTIIYTDINNEIIPISINEYYNINIPANYSNVIDITTFDDIDISGSGEYTSNIVDNSIVLTFKYRTKITVNNNYINNVISVTNTNRNERRIITTDIDKNYIKKNIVSSIVETDTPNYINNYKHLYDSAFIWDTKNVEINKEYYIINYTSYDNSGQAEEYITIIFTDDNNTDIIKTLDYTINVRPDNAIDYTNQHCNLFYYNADYRDSTNLVSVQLSNINYPNYIKTINFSFAENSIGTIIINDINVHFISSNTDILSYDLIYIYSNYPRYQHLEYTATEDFVSFDTSNISITPDFRNSNYYININASDNNFNINNNDFNIEITEYPPLKFNSGDENTRIITIDNLSNSSIIHNIFNDITVYAVHCNLIFSNSFLSNCLTTESNNYNQLKLFTNPNTPTEIYNSVDSNIYNITFNPEYNNKTYEIWYNIYMSGYESQYIQARFIIIETNIPYIIPFSYSTINKIYYSNIEDISNLAELYDYPYSNELRFNITPTEYYDYDISTLTFKPNFRNINYSLNIEAYDPYFTNTINQNNSNNSINFNITEKPPLEFTNIPQFTFEYTLHNTSTIVSYIFLQSYDRISNNIVASNPSITIYVNDSITFINKSGGHPLSIKNEDDVNINFNGTITDTAIVIENSTTGTWKFTTIGIYKYYCTSHPSMTNTITVIAIPNYNDITNITTKLHNLGRIEYFINIMDHIHIYANHCNISIQNTISQNEDIAIRTAHYNTTYPDAITVNNNSNLIIAAEHRDIAYTNTFTIHMTGYTNTTLTRTYDIMESPIPSITHTNTTYPATQSELKYFILKDSYSDYPYNDKLQFSIISAKQNQDDADFTDEIDVSINQGLSNIDDNCNLFIALEVDKKGFEYVIKAEDIEFNMSNTDLTITITKTTPITFNVDDFTNQFLTTKYLNNMSNSLITIDFYNEFVSSIKSDNILVIQPMNEYNPTVNGRLAYYSNAYIYNEELPYKIIDSNVNFLPEYRGTSYSNIFKLYASNIVTNISYDTYYLQVKYQCEELEIIPIEFNTSHKNTIFTTDTIPFNNIDERHYDLSTLYTYPYLNYLEFTYNIDSDIPYNDTVMEQSNLHIILKPKLRGKNYNITIIASDLFTHSNTELNININETPAIRFTDEDEYPNDSAYSKPITIYDLTNTQIICNLENYLIINNHIETHLLLFNPSFDSVEDAHYDNTMNKKALIHENTTIFDHNICNITTEIMEDYNGKTSYKITENQTVNIHLSETTDFSISFKIHKSEDDNINYFKIFASTTILEVTATSHVLNITTPSMQTITHSIEPYTGWIHIVIIYSAGSRMLFIDKTKINDNYDGYPNSDDNISIELNSNIEYFQHFKVINKILTIDDIAYLYNHDNDFIFYDRKNLYINPEYRNTTYNASISMSISGYEEISRTLHFNITECNIPDIILKQEYQILVENCNLCNQVIICNINDLYDNYPFSNHLIFSYETDITKNPQSQDYDITISDDNNTLNINANYRDMIYTVSLIATDSAFNITNSNYNVLIHEKPPIEFIDLTKIYTETLCNLENTIIICNINNYVKINVDNLTPDNLIITNTRNAQLRTGHYNDLDAFNINNSNLTIRPEYRNETYTLDFNIYVEGYQQQIISKKYIISECNIPPITIDTNINTNFSNLSNVAINIDIQDYYVNYPFNQHLLFKAVLACNVPNTEQFSESSISVSTEGKRVTIIPNFRNNVDNEHDYSYKIRIFAYDSYFSSYANILTENIYNPEDDKLKILDITDVSNVLKSNDLNNCNLVDTTLELFITEIPPIEFHTIINTIYYCNLEHIQQTCNIGANIKNNTAINNINITLDPIATQYLQYSSDLLKYDHSGNCNIIINPEYRNTSYYFDVKIWLAEYAEQYISQRFFVHECNIPPIYTKYSEIFSYENIENTDIVSLLHGNDLTQYYTYHYSNELSFTYSVSNMTVDRNTNNREPNIDIADNTITITPDYLGFKYRITIIATDDHFNISNNEFYIEIEEKPPIEFINNYIDLSYSNIVFFSNLTTNVETYNIIDNIINNVVTGAALNEYSPLNAAYDRQYTITNDPIDSTAINAITIAPNYRGINYRYNIPFYYVSRENYRITLTLDITECNIPDIALIDASQNEITVSNLSNTEHIINFSELYSLYEYPFSNSLVFTSNTDSDSELITIQDNEIHYTPTLSGTSNIVTIKAYDPNFTHPFANILNNNSNLSNTELSYKFIELPAIEFIDNTDTFTLSFNNLTTAQITCNIDDLIRANTADYTSLVLEPEPVDPLDPPVYYAKYLEGNNSNAIYFEQSNIYINPEYRGLTYSCNISIGIDEYTYRITLTLNITECNIPDIKLIDASQNEITVSNLSNTEHIITFSELYSLYEYPFSNTLVFTSNADSDSDLITIQGNAIHYTPTLSGTSNIVTIKAYDPNFTHPFANILNNNSNLSNTELSYKFIELPAIEFRDNTDTFTLSFNNLTTAQITCNIDDLIRANTADYTSLVLEPVDPLDPPVYYAKYLEGNNSNAIYFEQSNIYINPEYRGLTYSCNISIGIDGYSYRITLTLDITECNIPDIKLIDASQNEITVSNLSNTDHIITFSDLYSLYEYPFSNTLVFTSNVDSDLITIQDNEIHYTPALRGTSNIVTIKAYDPNFTHPFANTNILNNNSNLSNTELSYKFIELPAIEFRDNTDTFTLNFNNLTTAQITCNIDDLIRANTADYTSLVLEPEPVDPLDPPVYYAKYLEGNNSNAIYFEQSNIYINPEYRGLTYSCNISIGIDGYSYRITLTLDITECNIPDIKLIDASQNEITVSNLSNTEHIITFSELYSLYEYPFSNTLVFTSNADSDLITIQDNEIHYTPALRGTSNIVTIKAYDPNFTHPFASILNNNSNLSNTELSYKFIELPAIEVKDNTDFILTNDDKTQSNITIDQTYLTERFNIGIANSNIKIILESDTDTDTDDLSIIIDFNYDNYYNCNVDFYVYLENYAEYRINSNFRIEYENLGPPILKNQYTYFNLVDTTAIPTDFEDIFTNISNVTYLTSIIHSISDLENFTFTQNTIISCNISSVEYTQLYVNVSNVFDTTEVTLHFINSNFEFLAIEGLDLTNVSCNIILANNESHTITFENTVDIVYKNSSIETVSNFETILTISNLHRGIYYDLIIDENNYHYVYRITEDGDLAQPILQRPDLLDSLHFNLINDSISTEYSNVFKNSLDYDLYNITIYNTNKPQYFSFEGNTLTSEATAYANLFDPASNVIDVTVSASNLYSSNTETLRFFKIEADSSNIKGLTNPTDTINFEISDIYCNINIGTDFNIIHYFEDSIQDHVIKTDDCNLLISNIGRDLTYDVVITLCNTTYSYIYTVTEPLTTTNSLVLTERSLYYYYIDITNIYNLSNIFVDSPSYNIYETDKPDIFTINDNILTSINISNLFSNEYFKEVVVKASNIYEHTEETLRFVRSDYGTLTVPNLLDNKVSNIYLLDNRVTYDIGRSFSIAYNPIQTGCNLVIENESNLIINDDYRGIYDVIINLESNIHNILRINERIDNTVENTFIL